MIINGSGNVGIGTTNPGYLLDVSTAVVGGTTDMRVFNSATTDAASGTRGIISVANAAVGDPRLVLAITGVKEYSLGIDNSDSDKFKINNGSDPSSGTNYLTIDSGAVGIGTTAPSMLLHVAGPGRFSSTTTTISATTGLYLSIGSSVNNYNGILFQGVSTYDMYFGRAAGTGVDDLVINNGTNELVRFKSTGNVGIGTSNPGYKLDVSGTIRATGDVIAYSDARVKENVETIPNAIDKVKAMRGVGYNKIGEQRRSTGVIAQEILEVLPEVVHQDENGMYSVAYGNIVGVLIEAIKDQQKQIDELKAKLK